MVKTKGVERTLSKWVSRVEVAGPDYEAGIKAPKEDWATQAAAAEPTWAKAIAEAAARKAFSKGITDVGTAKWQSRALSKGVGRFPEGVRLAKDDYRAAMGDVLGVIEGVTLPTRGPRGDPRNLDRVRKIMDTLHAWKVKKG